MKKLKIWFTHNSSMAIVSVLLALIVGVGIFLRSYQIGKLSFWNDEIDTFMYAKDSFQSMLQSDPNMSLYYSIAHFWVRIFPGASEGTLRALSAIFSIAGIPFVFLLGRTIGIDRKKAMAIGLVAALLVALNAFNIQYAQEFRSYSLVFLLATLSTFLFIKAVEEPPGPSHYWGVWYTIVTAAAVYSHFFVVFLIVAQASSLLVLFLGKRRTFPFGGVLRSGIGMAILIYPIASVALTKGAGQISWIPEPTLNTVKNFATELTGNQGELLLSLYLLLGGIGLLAGVRAWRQKDLIINWKFTLIANCLFLPIIIALILSKVIMPVFMPYYLLYTMPYFVILVAIGIITLATLGWKKSRKFRFITIPLGIAVLVLTVVLSVAGIQSYFKKYQKENWRGAAQFLTMNCSSSLRLYYTTYVEKDALYYNSNLRSQVWELWEKILKKNPSSKEIVASIPVKYSQVCLVLSHTNQDKVQSKIIQTAIQTKFPKVTTIRYYGIDIEIYR